KNIRAKQDAAIQGSQQSDKKIEPIRNRGDKIGRNDPCPCGSGKKFKNCCMKKSGYYCQASMSMTQPKTEPEIAGAESVAPPQPRPLFTVRSFGLTDTGRVRPANEDHFVVVELARTLYVHHTSLPQAQLQ